MFVGRPVRVDEDDLQHFLPYAYWFNKAARLPFGTNYTINYTCPLCSREAKQGHLTVQVCCYSTKGSQSLDSEHCHVVALPRVWCEVCVARVFLPVGTPSRSSNPLLPPFLSKV